MDRLWTPWRFDYIRGIGSSEPGCVFCRIRDEADDEANYVLCRGRSHFVLLNLFPYTSGHLLIVAGRHIPCLEQATPEELSEISEAAQRCERALRAEYRPDGFNMGFNIGRAAGAGVEHHLHMHVVPRWSGDANFLSVVGETRVLPEELPRTYARLVPRLRG
jgi:ATP adenylyltransferase